jgi:TatD DNase family protein
MDASGPDVVAAARSEGVEGMITVGVDLISSRQAIALAGQLPGVRATVGVHPNDSTGYGEVEEAELDRLAQAKEVVGIGEAGLDYYRKGASAEEQERSFRSQIRLAKRHNLALVVHTRDAHADTKRVISDEGPPDRLVMHCFSGDEKDAADYLDLGAVLSFAGPVTFTNARDVQRAAIACPLDRLVLETDSPFLSPHPFRGRPNSPARVPVIGRFVAALKGITPDELASAVHETSGRLWSCDP